MMPIIVDHADARSLAFELKAAIDPAKTVKPETDLLHRNIKRDANSDSGRGIQHIVRARNVERKFSESFSL